jgi:hypothetical protein
VTAVRKKIAVGVGLVGVFLAMMVVMCASFRSWNATPRVKVADLEQKIDRELPVGSRKQDVVTWLRDRSMAVHESSDQYGQFVIESWINDSGPRAEHPFGIRDIRIRFIFDNKESLVKVTVQEEDRF